MGSCRILLKKLLQSFSDGEFSYSQGFQDPSSPSVDGLFLNQTQFLGRPADGNSVPFYFDEDLDDFPTHLSYLPPTGIVAG